MVMLCLNCFCDFMYYLKKNFSVLCIFFGTPCITYCCITHRIIYIILTEDKVGVAADLLAVLLGTEELLTLLGLGSEEFTNI